VKERTGLRQSGEEKKERGTKEQGRLDRQKEGNIRLKGGKNNQNVLSGLLEEKREEGKSKKVGGRERQATMENGLEKTRCRKKTTRSSPTRKPDKTAWPIQNGKGEENNGHTRV